MRVLICLFLLIAFVVTIYLFMFNRFNVSCFGKKYYFVTSEVKAYKKGSLLIIKHDLANINVDDEILFYNVNTTKRNVLQEKVLAKEYTNEKETTFALTNNRFVSSSYVLGRANDVKVIPVIGSILNIFTSYFGYLFLILLPVLAMFVYQVRALVKKHNLWGIYD